ncbi:MAG: aminodeoxychorismate/anthranilate synthase component II [Bacteroidota bacterium]
MKILVLDNYDSFTYNLVQYLKEICTEQMDVFRNDAISLDEVDRYDVIVLSPGPGIPSEAGIMPELIQRYAATKSIFGVCLGQQAIGEAFGGKLLNLKTVYHGIATPIHVTDREEALFEELPDSFTVGRYHSWVVDRLDFPEILQITSVDSEDTVMSLRHKEYHVKGVQFHPESIMTEYGKEMLQNFLREARQITESRQLSQAI